MPLGWDGKPIPYWLYKLHGLNISYKCEICGNFTYKGPKAFQRHFAEWRHAHGKGQTVYDLLEDPARLYPGPITYKTKAAT